MKSFNTVLKLSVLIALLAAVAAGSGLLWQGSGDSYPFTTLRGETVMIRGHGLYRYDTVASSSQEIGQDIVTLLVGIPLLVYAMLRTRKDAMRGKLLLTGGLAYFLYTYASMSFLTAFNAFFLVYVALFSLSLFAFILALMALDPAEVAAHIGERFPRRAITTYFLVVAAFLALAWLGLVVPPMLTGTAPAGLESAITMVIQALDLGVIVPTAILTALLLRKGNAWGYTLSLVVLLKILTMGAALISMIIVQLLSGVAVDPVVTAGFGVISLSGIILAAMTLRTIND
ncbi:hypothetical protein [Pelolinea submarina]|uniref:Uncharacterized protein n=1 Tax=Pelolinea submarina TaxID=913107 RepID=A0A347ZPI0_9CHLR|nr:hypothetical protein [Pelolinea submarina]REG04775.1 hypothetical protein DFR64_3127 [Pelolinea submarina]BBB47211.1 hypothetical protein Pelsub_P0438 [Pelolinea submarina]